MEFVPFDKTTADVVEMMHREAYPPELIIWDKESLTSEVFAKQKIGRFSFLLFNSSWIGHSLSFMGISTTMPPSDEPTLYIADLVVRPQFQGKGYGRVMAEEILRRANEADISHVEFFARESTSYSAINVSSHTVRVLGKFGYAKAEHERERFKKWRKSEYGRLISLEKIENNT